MMSLEHRMEQSIELGDRRSHMVLENELEDARRRLEIILRTRSDG